MPDVRVLILAALLVASPDQPARAQTVATGAAAGDGWHVTVYPVLAWIPLSIEIETDIPPVNGDGGGSGEILDSRFDGAFFAGVSASNNVWRIEGYGLWAGFGGDRPERPFLTVELDLIYGSARVGRRIAPDLYLTGGVRRVALDYDIRFNELPTLSRKPGIWDPLVGIGWHRERPKVEWHALIEGGGFGAGAEIDVGASFTVDWKPLPHFGFTGGYSFLYLKVEDSVSGRDITLKTTVHGPTVGFGLYF